VFAYFQDFLILIHFLPAFSLGRVAGTAVPGGLEISHGFQQFHTVAVNATDDHNHFVN